MKREQGYYWVKFKSRAGWYIAQWEYNKTEREGFFYIHNSYEQWPELAFEKIIPKKLTSPVETQGENKQGNETE